MKKYLLVLCAVMGVFAACKKNNLPPVDALKSISLKDTTIKVGQTIQLNITTSPADYDKTLLRLSSSDTTVLTVKNDGHITAKKTGSAVVTVTNQLKTVSATSKVSVIAATEPLTGILFRDTLTMDAGDVIQLNYTTTPPNYDPKLLVWKSSDTTVLSVSNTGKVTAKQAGVSTVTLTNTAASFSVSGIVEVTDNLRNGLLAFYPFNGNTNDQSGHNHNGSAYDLTSAPDRFGKPNSAYYFNGVSSYIKVEDAQELRLNNTNFTLSVWIKLTTYNSSFGSAILVKRIDGYDTGWLMSIRGYEDGPLGVVTYGSGGGNVNAFGTVVVGTGNWNMVSCVYNVTSSKLSIYVNGVLDHTVDNIPTANALISAALYIGKDNPQVPSTGYYLNGTLDDIRIYGRALNAIEIKKLYNLTH